MAAGLGNLLQQFVVGIVFQVNRANEQEATAAVGRVNAAFERYRREQEERNRRLAEDTERTTGRMREALDRGVTSAIRRLTFELGALATAVAGIRALENTFERLRQISDISDRTGAAAEDIMDLGAAFRSMGSSQKEAIGGIEALASSIRQNPGILTLLRSMGVTETQAGTKQQLQLSAAFKSIIRQYGENGIAVALQYGKLLGLSDEYIRNLTDNYGKEEGTFARHLARMEGIRKAWNNDTKKTLEDNKKLWEEWARSATHLEEFQKAIVAGLTPVVTAFLKPMNDALLRNAGAFGSAIGDLGKALEGWSGEKGKEFAGWLERLVKDPEAQKRFGQDLRDVADGVKTLGNALIFTAQGLARVLHDAKAAYDWMKAHHLLQNLDEKAPSTTTGQSPTERVSEALSAAQVGIEPTQQLGTGASFGDKGSANEPNVPGRGWTYPSWWGGGITDKAPWPTLGRKTSALGGGRVQVAGLDEREAFRLGLGAGQTGDGKDWRSEHGDPFARFDDDKEAQQRAADTQEKAAETQKDTAEQQQRWWSTAWEQAKKFAGDLVAAIAPALGQAIGSGIAGQVGQSVGQGVGDALRGGGGGGGGGAPGAELAKGQGAAILDAVSKAEGTKGYSDSFGHQLTGDLTGKTLNEIDQIQGGMKGSSAIGRYQFMRATLQGLRKELNLSGNEKFTPELQDRLGQRLLQRRGYDEWKSGKISNAQFMDRLAQEWAGVTSSTGKSVHAGVGLNRQTGSTVEAMNQALLKDKSGYSGPAQPTGFDTAGAGAGAGAGEGGGKAIGAQEALKLAVSNLGAHEARDTQKLSAYFKRAGYNVNPADTAWCAYYVSASLKQAGIDPSSSPGLATSYLRWGTGVSAQNVQAGDVVVEPKGAGFGRRGGHVGIATGETRINPQTGQFQVKTISGNYSNQVKEGWENASEVNVRRAATVRANAERTNGSDGQTGAGLPLTSGPVANDNSRHIQQNNTFNTRVHAADAREGASAFRRSNEQLAGMATRQLGRYMS